MKKVLITLSMVGLLAYAASMSFGAGQTIQVPWFFNDENGVMGFFWDTWFSCKNLTYNTFALTVDYYDDSDYLTIATSETVLLVPGGVYPVYTGKPAMAKAQGGYGMGPNCDRGSAVIRWPDQPGYGGARGQVQGYIQFVAIDLGAISGINFEYK